MQIEQHAGFTLDITYRVGGLPGRRKVDKPDAAAQLPQVRPTPSLVFPARVSRQSRHWIPREVAAMQALFTEISSATDRRVFLIGRPPMSEFLGAAGQTLEGQTTGPGALADAWRAANDRIRELEQDESGWADAPRIEPVDDLLTDRCDRVMRDPTVQRSFAAIPYEIGVVELDRLVVYQKHVNLSYVDELKAMLGNDPSEEEIFQFCLPVDRRYDPPVQGARIAPNVWSFSSPSSDLRLLDLNMIDPSTINGLEPGGVAVAIVGATLGYGSNYLNALRVETRLILNNGTHRAFALRDMGLTHAPCLIQNTSRREELDIVGVPDLQERADLFFTHPRPPLLKDYFDPKLRMLLNVPRTQRQIRIAVQVEQLDVPGA